MAPLVSTVWFAVLLAAGHDLAQPANPVVPRPEFSLVTNVTVTVTDLGTLGGEFSVARAINDLGQVVGTSQTAAGQTHAFVWTDGTLRDLGTLGGFSQPVAINNLGQVIGSSFTPAGQEHAFLSANGAMQDLGTLGGQLSTPRAISDFGLVVGLSSNAAGQEHAFLWANGMMEDLGTLAGRFSFSDAVAVNELGQVVGNSTAAGEFVHAFLWANGEMQDLGTLGGEKAQRTMVLTTFSMRASIAVTLFARLTSPTVWTPSKQPISKTCLSARLKRSCARRTRRSGIT